MGESMAVLFVEDDSQSLDQFRQILPDSIANFDITWEFCQSFDKALVTLAQRRFDVVATDVYLDPPDHDDKSGLGHEQARGLEIVKAIRLVRFCPIVVFTDGPTPDDILETAFIRVVDKTQTEDLIQSITQVLNTGIPAIAKALHDEIDKEAGSYLWNFLESTWDRLKEAGLSERAILGRIIRRRAALQLGRLNPATTTPTELEEIEGAEAYIYPRISGETVRLGEILRDRASGEFSIVVTPHCHLVAQPEEPEARAEYVLTVRAVPVAAVLNRHYGDRDPWAGSDTEKRDKLRRRTQSPVGYIRGAAGGRYFFLPRFLEIPHLYCDFQQVSTFELPKLVEDHDRLAVLDAPFAEDLQASFGRFYSAVGTPNLNIEGLMDLIEPGGASST